MSALNPCGPLASDPLTISAADTQRSQSAAWLLLVRPAAFGYNEQTAQTNHFQQPSELGTARALQERACAQFDALCAQLRAAGVRLCVAQDSQQPPKPDAIFPNNWVSWHHDGSVVLYPMQPRNRRPERRMELVAAVEAQTGFRRRRLIDLSRYEAEGRYLEGTGSLVLDHRRRVAYACRSARTDSGLVGEWARLLGYEPVIFDALAPDGTAPYHTNVMLAIGTRWCIVCSSAIVPAERERVLARLSEAGRSVVDISPEAMQRFAGNVLEVRAGERQLLALSASAANALRAEGTVWQALQACVDECVIANVDVIERAGGGSVRCMLAEVFVA